VISHHINPKFKNIYIWIKGNSSSLKETGGFSSYVFISHWWDIISLIIFFMILYLTVQKALHCTSVALITTVATVILL